MKGKSVKGDKAPTGADKITSGNGPNGLRLEIRLIIEVMAREAVACERAQAPGARVDDAKR